MAKSLGELEWNSLCRNIRNSSGPRRTGNDMKDLIKLLRRMEGGSPARTGGRVFDSRQEAVLKLMRGSSMRSHIEHLQGYLPQKGKDVGGASPILFGNCSSDEYRRRMDKNYFHMVLSPGLRMERDDLEALAKVYMDRCCSEIGRRILWQAAVHTDTPHPHVHILINGRDMDGWKTFLPRSFIRKGGREIARDMLTLICGSRSEKEIMESEERRLSAARWTMVDKDIVEAMLPDGNGGGFIANAEGRMSKRLKALSNLGLAEWSNGYWHVAANLEDDLRAQGRYGVFFDSKSVVSSTKPYRVYTPDDGVIRGRVIKTYRMDGESVWTNAVVVETDHRTYFVPTWGPPSVAMGMDATISARPGQNGKLSIHVHSSHNAMER